MIENVSPMPTLGPDPRVFTYLAVSLLEVDPGEQRDITKSRQARICRISETWDWNRCEAITVRLTEAGKYKVVEGQGRVLALRMLDPDALVPCLIISVDAVQAAGVASGIAKGRTGHTKYDHWKLAVRRGDEYEVAAEGALAARFLRVGLATSTNVIGAVGVVSSIIHAHRSRPGEGADVLGQVVDILIAAYPSDVPRNSSLRWKAVMLRTVHAIVAEVPIEPPEYPFLPLRLAKVLSGVAADQWINMAKGKDSAAKGDEYIIETMVAEYNKRLQYGRLVL
jgi:hypothetical protein